MVGPRIVTGGGGGANGLVKIRKAVRCLERRSEFVNMKQGETDQEGGENRGIASSGGLVLRTGSFSNVTEW